MEWQAGDVLLLHTGFLGWYVRQEASLREAIAQRGALRVIGLAHDEEMARYLWNAHVAAVVSDNPGVEVWPADSSDAAFPFGFLHRILIGQFGMALGELWWLEDLALSCRRDGRYAMFLTAAPINVPGASARRPTPWRSSNARVTPARVAAGAPAADARPAPRPAGRRRAVRGEAEPRTRSGGS